MPTEKRRRSNGYMCKECGASSPKMMGRCPVCSAWNTMVDAPPEPLETVGAIRRAPSQVVLLSDAAVSKDAERIATGMGQLDFVLGGGVVRGSFVILSGEPGVGKSTIALQLLAKLLSGGHSGMYSSGEESAHQVGSRAVRLGGSAPHVHFVAETNMEALEAMVVERSPEILVVDSIQTLQSEGAAGGPGHPAQMRYCAHVLQRLAKDRGMAIFIIGHVTKDGSVAGPKFLEHLVDTVLYFAHVGDGEHRLVRAVKNRFGSIDEIAVFRMTGEGLVAVDNPSELFLADRNAGISGSAITSVIEGTQPVLVEVQALVTGASYGTPQRVATGYSRKRLALLTAILEKRAGLPFSQYDVFINVAGGIEITDHASDAAVLAALASSVYDAPLPPSAIFLGETGLGGEMRRIGQADRRLGEAARLGFEKAFVPTNQRVNGNPIAIERTPDLATLLKLSLDWKPGKLPKTAQPPLRGALRADAAVARDKKRAGE